jgi:hypothetical protein
MRPKPSPGPGATAEALVGNERGHVRYLCGEGAATRLVSRPVPGGRRALLRDVSAGGVGLLLDHPLEVGRPVAVDLWDAPGASCARLAKVVHVRPHPAPAEAGRPAGGRLPALLRRLLGLRPARREGGWWFVGCEFDLPLTDDDVRRALDDRQGPVREG